MECSSRDRDRLRDLASGTLVGPEADQALLHALACPRCRAELDLLVDLTKSFADAAGSASPGKPALRRPSVVRWRLAWAAAAILLVAAAVEVASFLGKAGEGASLRALADITPIPFVEGVLRDAAAGRASRFPEAMSAYKAGDYSTAASSLWKLLEEDPADHKLRIYLGISLLQLEKPGAAIEALSPAAVKAEGLLRERALWYTAMANLLLEDESGARRCLEAIRGIEGASYGLNAAEILQKINSRGRP